MLVANTSFTTSVETADTVPSPRAVGATENSPPHAYNGIFPCFFGGFLSRLVCNISSASIIFFRVSCG